ncbi:MAG: tryptophan-rich sensory protein [Cyanobacteria bacterium J06598_3]
MRKSMGSIARQWLTVVAVLMAIALNGVSNIFPPAGKNVGEVSNTVLGGVLITPAGYAFAIWGLIYLGLIAYSIYQALPGQRQNAAIAQTSWMLIGACVLQMVWLYAFLMSNFWLSVGLIAGILGCLMVGYVRSRSVIPTRQVRWLFQAPISVYFAWITVATVVNVAGALYDSFFAGGPAMTAIGVACTVLMMAISAAIAAVVALRYGDASFAAVVVWALCAIAIRQAIVPPLAFIGVGLAVGLSILMVRIVVNGQGRIRQASIADRYERPL